MITFKKPVDITTDKEREDFIIGIDELGVEWWIPTDPANSSYQAYLTWLAEQDEVTE